MYSKTVVNYGTKNCLLVWRELSESFIGFIKWKKGVEKWIKGRVYNNFWMNKKLSNMILLKIWKLYGKKTLDQWIKKLKVFKRK